MSLGFLLGSMLRCQSIRAVTKFHAAPRIGGAPKSIFWNARKRYIPIRPRTVHRAYEFRMPVEQADQDGVARLLGMFEAGADVNAHLSRYAKNPQPLPKKREKHKPDPFHDGLLNHWDIQHFHWNDGAAKSKPRSSMILFAMVKANDVYIIDVLAHGVWSRQDLLERVHLNWPFLLKPFKQPREDKVPGFQRLTDQQLAKLRRKGYSAGFMAQDGTEYLPPGGGQVSAGVGLDVVMRANRAAGVVSHWNERMKESHESIVDLFERHGAAVPASVTLKRKIDDNDVLHVFEPTFGFTITLGPLFPS